MVRENDLSHFVEAQEPVYSKALGELRNGRKRSHWMWFIFPQLAGLGRSSMAARFAIENAAEADAYLKHSILGPRLRECVAATLIHRDRNAQQIFGSPDDLKFRSSLTLFAAVSPDEELFREALALFYDGQPDPKTLKVLAEHQPV
jgi:uncharacterized protein (DUF1810 family)